MILSKEEIESIRQEWEPWSPTKVLDSHEALRARLIEVHLEADRMVQENEDFEAERDALREKVKSLEEALVESRCGCGI